MIMIFSFWRHVQNICFAQIRDLKCIRGYLTCHAALMAVNALVFNFANAFLQCVQNSLARITTKITNAPVPPKD